ncbi:MAG: single-stranded DNA-binding protein [Treponema sp.]|nr:single-stranded DNA-binding protein [Treponema sp.]
MNQLNSIILEGNVVKKAEFSEPKTGFQVCKFPLAVNRKSKTPEGETKEEVSYFDVETYGEMAESCYKWCDKGLGVRVVGRLKQSRWEENNKKHSRVYVVAEHVEYKFSKPKPEEKAPEVVQAEATVDAATEPAKEAATAEAVF